MVLLPRSLPFFFLTWLFFSPFWPFFMFLLPLTSLCPCLLFSFSIFYHTYNPLLTHTLTHGPNRTHTRALKVWSHCLPRGVKIKRPSEPWSSVQPWRVSDCLLNLLWHMDRCTTAAVWVWNGSLKEYEEKIRSMREDISQPPKWTSQLASRIAPRSVKEAETEISFY